MSARPLPHKIRAGGQIGAGGARSAPSARMRAAHNLSVRPGAAVACAQAKPPEAAPALEATKNLAPAFEAKEI
jgi:hypothetical protein